MPYNPESSTAVHALDQTQQLAANKQYSWLSGADVTTTGSTSSIETAVSSGRATWDGEQITIPGGNHTHPAGDTDNPRWDALCVTDRTGTVEVFTGIPNEVVTDNQGDPVRGEPAFSPAPSDNITAEMVCLALVWIPSGATNNTDLTDETNGGVANPVVDRRVYQAGRVDQTTRRKTINSSGWYTIASNAPLGTGPTAEKRCNGLFTVRDTQSGRHSSMTFYASYMYGADPTITLLNASNFAGHRAIRGVRLVNGGTDEGAMVQVNVQLDDRNQIDFAEYTLQNNYQYGGWYPEHWQSGTVPQGFETTVLDFNNGDYIMAAVANGTEQFVVGRDGAVGTRRVFKDETAARVYLSSNFSVDGSGQTIPYDTIKSDDWGAWDSSTGVFTAPYDGWYTVHGHARLETPSDGQRVDLFVRHNGAGQAVTRIPVGSSSVTTFGVQTIIDAAAGDTIEIEERHAGGGTLTIAGNPRETYATIVHEG
jgi:hypothetical protein